MSTSALPRDRSITSVSRTICASMNPCLPYVCGIFSDRSLANLSSSNSPFFHQRNPSGCVAIDSTTSSSLTFWLPPIWMPETASRFPSSTTNVTFVPAATVVVSARVVAR
jgi:hypothetical protein